MHDAVKEQIFPSLIEQLNTSFEALIKIDKALFSILGLKEYEEIDEIKRIHLALSKELENLKEMMERD